MSASPPRGGPRVSIILPVRDLDDLFLEAVRSVLDQTYRDLELVIVTEPEGGDRVEGLVGELDDERIVVIRNQERLGLARSLNVGFARARGEYLARMDADDVSAQNRIEKQVRYLDDHPFIGVLGTWLDFEGGTPMYYSNDMLPPDPSLTRWELHFQNALAHPTIMMRRSVWDRLGGYLPEAEPCEDYELWLRAMRFTDLMSLPEPLVRYRSREESVSGARREEQKRKAQELAARSIEISLGKPVDRKLARAVVNPFTISEPKQGVSAAHFMYILYSNFSWWEKMPDELETRLRRDISGRLSDILVRSLRVGPQYSPMVIWQASRFGPRMFFSLLANTGRKGIKAIP